MPTINFSFEDFKNLLGKNISLEQLKELLTFCKAELEHCDKEENITISLNDTNMPYLWSVEGIVRLLKGVLGIEKSIPKLKINKGNYVVNVDKNIKKIRPYLFALVARGKKIDNYLLKQIIQLQEKICETYGRKREIISIGVYSYKNIQFPLFYKSVRPDSIKFVPLEFEEKLDLKQILQKHPKGREYGWIIEKFEKYPIFVDSSNEVLSFPPIINSNFLGKVVEGDTDIFIEVTGTDFDMVRLANNIFAHNLQDRGFDIYSVVVKYPEKTVVCPDNNFEKIKIKKEDIEKLIGLKTNDKEIKNLLEKARYSYNKGVVTIPNYRRDILHPVDIAEDFAIMFGYKKIKPLKLTTYTPGGTFKINELIDDIRELLVGLGYQEVFSPILTSKNLIAMKTLTKDEEIIEIENPMSESYSVVRNWIIPILLEFVGKNKHAEFPQKIFEEGIITVKGEQPKDYESLACVSCHKLADFTELKQTLEAVLRSLGIFCDIEEFEHPSFIPGRCGRVIVGGEDIGIIGEIAPEVLVNFEILFPVSAFEINITKLFKHTNYND